MSLTVVLLIVLLLVLSSLHGIIAVMTESKAVTHFTVSEYQNL